MEIMKRKKFNPRTPGEISRDSTICLMDKLLDIMMMHLESMRDSASFNHEYKHAENYGNLMNMVIEVQKIPRENKDEY